MLRRPPTQAWSHVQRSLVDAGRPVLPILPRAKKLGAASRRLPPSPCPAAERHFRHPRLGLGRGARGRKGKGNGPGGAPSAPGGGKGGMPPPKKPPPANPARIC